MFHSAGALSSTTQPRQSQRAARPAVLVPVLIISIVSLAAPRAADAQVLYGSLTGNFTDQAGAVVEGARVEVLNANTGVSKSATTDERGAYLFNDLQVGVYRLTITSASFKTASQEGVKIDSQTKRQQLRG
jgi:hypothetical protein